MGKYFTFLVLVVSIISCDKDHGIGCELEGEYVYERETFSSNSTFTDPDTRGTMIFNEDETGAWISDLGFFSDLSMEWDLQANDTKIAITRGSIFGDNSFFNTQLYTLTQNSEDSFTLNFNFKFDGLNDSIPGSERFENIILTRK